MKVKDLIEQLSKAPQDAHVHIQTDQRFEEDIKDIHNYADGYDSEVIVLSSLTQWRKV